MMLVCVFGGGGGGGGRREEEGRKREDCGVYCTRSLDCTYRLACVFVYYN